MDQYQISLQYHLDSRLQKPENRAGTVYEIMHLERPVATITAHGVAHILDVQFMPYDLWLEEESDFDTLINNWNVFQHWCASRVLSIDRKYAKELLNTIGAAQAMTDMDRASIALSYHCVSLTDVYWVRAQGEDAAFEKLNLYDHTLNEAIVEVSLRGKALTVTNRELPRKDFAPDLSTQGVFPKAWIRQADGFLLLKDGGAEVVRRELLASRICQCFDIPQVIYDAATYDGEPVSRSRIVTSKERSMVSRKAYDIYAINYDLDALNEICTLDPITYYGMNLLDYLIGNTDRHWENWGLLIDNATNQPISLYPLMDFNQSFRAYDTLDGDRCLTVSHPMTQRKAAIEAVKQIGLRQISPVDPEWFGDMDAEREMFQQRLHELKDSLE